MESILSRIPISEKSGFTEAMAMYFFRVGDQQPLDAHPTCRPPGTVNGTISLQAAAGNCGGNPA